MTAVAELVQQIGTAPGVDIVTPYLNLHRTDSYSLTQTSYIDEAIQVRSDGAPTYSYERWCRIRFTPPFDQVREMRFWATNLIIRNGWTVKWGTTSTFHNPTNSLSTYAVNLLPATDPGISAPNIGGAAQLGTAVRYSDWIVIQASVNGDAETGPVGGFDMSNHPQVITYHFAWTEN